MNTPDNHEWKRGDVVEVHMVGIVQNVCNGGSGLRITVDPQDSSGLYKTPGRRWWAVIPETAAKYTGRNSGNAYGRYTREDK